MADKGNRGLGVVSANRVALELRVDEEHAEDIRRHQEEHERGNHVDSHVLVIPPGGVPDASRSAGIAGTLR